MKKSLIALITGMMLMLPALALAEDAPVSEMTFILNTFSFLIMGILVIGAVLTLVGNLLAEKWNLPPKLISVILHHHQPSEAGRFVLESAIVHLADILCRSLNIGYGGDNKMPALDKIAWDSLRIKSQMIESMLAEINKEFDEISLFITYTP